MIDPTLAREMTNWHGTFLIRSENVAHMVSLFARLQAHELSIRQCRYTQPRPDRKAELVKIKAARQRLATIDWNADLGELTDEANALLSQAVDSAILDHRLGIPGEEAFNHVRDLRSGRSGRDAGHHLAAVVASGRLVRPTMGRCFKCGVAREIGELDKFTSTTSSEITYACHGEPAPLNRLDLGPWLRWFEGWEGPCCEPDLPEPATIN